MKCPALVPYAKRGFSLIELVVVILIMTVLAGVVVPRVLNHQKSARDARRLADAKTLQQVIDQYYMEKGTFPPADVSGWNKSTDANFISALVKGGYISEPIADPLNDTTYHFRYRVYNKGQFGCVGDTQYYVLGIRNFESDNFATKNKGYFKCSGKDFGTSFDFVTGGGASFE